MRRNRKLKGYYIALTVTFLLLTAACTLLVVLMPKSTYSTEEKRVLAQFETPTVDTVLSGKWMSSIEDFAKDQFPARGTLMKVKTEAMRVLGTRESQGVYYLSDGSLAERFTMPEGGAIREMTDAVNHFAERNEESTVAVMIIPTAIEYKRGLLPENAPTDSESLYISALYDAVSDSVLTVSVNEAFSAMDPDEIYYRTDHHLTTDGAKTAAETLLMSLGIEPKITADSGIVRNDFLGSLASKSGFTPERLDSVKLYRLEADPKNDFYFTVNYVAEQELAATVYDASKLATDDPYAVFFGGNHPEIVITTSVETDRKLLIIKDSYANAVIPFLVPYFQKITVIDPRYYAGNIDALTEEGRFTDIVLLYNANTLSTDRSLSTVLRNEQ